MDDMRPSDSESAGNIKNEGCDIPVASEEIASSSVFEENLQKDPEHFAAEVSVPSGKQPEEPEVLETSDNEKWLDILGSGDFKKKIIKHGLGEDSRPAQRNWVTANIYCYDSSGSLIESHENFVFRLGDLDVIRGLDMAVALMEMGERAEVLVPSRLAYGKFGRKPDIPPNSDLKYDVEILNIEDGDDDSKLKCDERLKLGNNKKEQGNYWYGLENYLNAVHCYQRAAAYLDAIDGSDNPPDKLQLILNTRITVNNNLAAAHLKMEAHDSALKALDFVVKMQPNNVKAHFRKGKVLAAKGLTADALAEMKIAAKLDPESKAIQLELQRLQKKKLIEDNAQKAMYQRMFGSNSSSKPKSGSKSSSWFTNHWSLLAGGVAAVAAVGVAAYRQYHYTG